MKAKNFQTVSKLLSWFFKFYTGLLIFFAILSVGGFLASFFVEPSTFENLALSTDEGIGFTLFFINDSIDELRYAQAMLLAAPVFIGIMSYVSLQASRLFDRLYEGDSPFTYNFAEKVKKISYLLILVDVLDPIIRTITVNLFTEMGSYFYIGVTHWTLLGLVLYLVSAVLNHGVSLQELSDETV